MSVDIYSVVCWAFHILGRRIFIFVETKLWLIYFTDFSGVQAVILYAGWGGRRETCQHRQWLVSATLLMWNRKEIRKTAVRLIVSFQRTRRPRYANQRMPMNRVETSKHTHRELIHLLSFSLSIWRWYYSSPFNECARHLSLNTSRHRAHSTALSKGWTRVLVWLDPGLLLLLQASLSYAGTYIQSLYIPPFTFDYYSVGPYRLLGLISCGPHLSHGRAPFSPIQTGATTTTNQPAQKILRIARPTNV